MNKMHFQIAIRAPRQKVWDTMLEPDGYKAWTAEFSPGSYFEGSWEQGSRIRFLTPEGNGMFSQIAENRPGEALSIHHLGIIKDGLEAPSDSECSCWGEAFEKYRLFEDGGVTRLRVELDVPPDFEAFMNEAWPKALAKLKELCERQPT